MKDIHFQGDLPSSSEELGACLNVRVNKAAWTIAIRSTAYYISLCDCPETATGMKSHSEIYMDSVPVCHIQQPKVYRQSVWTQTKLFFITIKLGWDHWKPL